MPFLAKAIDMTSLAARPTAESPRSSAATPRSPCANAATRHAPSLRRTSAMGLWTRYFDSIEQVAVQQRVVHRRDLVAARRHRAVQITEVKTRTHRIVRNPPRESSPRRAGTRCSGLGRRTTRPLSRTPRDVTLSLASPTVQQTTAAVILKRTYRRMDVVLVIGRDPAARHVVEIDMLHAVANCTV